MSERARPSHVEIRTAEVVASLCLATDLGMGFPFEHGLHATLTTLRLCEALGVDPDTASHAFYASLLMYSACTVDAETTTTIFRGSLADRGYHNMYGSPLQAVASALGALPDPESPRLRRVYEFTSNLPRALRFRKPHFIAHCEVAEMLSERLGLPQSINGLFPLITERWDGKSHLRLAKGDEIPLPLRIAHVGRDATYHRLMGDNEHVAETMRRRSGGAFDPKVVRTFVADAGEILAAIESPESAWDDVLAAEPKPPLTLKGEAIHRAMAAIGSFSDLASPYLSGHSRGVGDLAADAARIYGFEEQEATTIRRAGYVHDVGRAAVHPRVWASTGPLSTHEWEQVRLHTYHTERVLHRSPFLASLTDIACTHHERLDGSGYHRSIGASALTPACRLLAVADAYRSKTEPRAYRKSLAPGEAAAVVAERARQGKLDPDMVAVVVEAAGQEPPRVERPAGLTERELEVIGLLARGLQTKQMARVLDISPKTADRHIQNTYRKIGVSSRAAATLFATEHGLVPKGEPPIPEP